MTYQFFVRLFFLVLNFVDLEKGSSLQRKSAFRCYFVVYNRLLRIQHVVELLATPTYSTSTSILYQIWGSSCAQALEYVGVANNCGFTHI